MKSNWKILTCHYEDDSRDIVAEVQIDRHHNLNARSLENLIEDLLDEVGDPGEYEYELEFSPAILVHRHPQEYVPILEVALRVITTDGHWRPPVTGLDGDTVDALRRQNRSYR